MLMLTVFSSSAVVPPRSRHGSSVGQTTRDQWCPIKWLSRGLVHPKLPRQSADSPAPRSPKSSTLILPFPAVRDLLVNDTQRASPMIGAIQQPVGLEPIQRRAEFLGLNREIA